MILQIFSAGPLDTNTLLIGCSETHKGAVIDVPFASAHTLVKRARELSLTVEKILLTHSHWDHIGEVALLKSELKAPVYIHEEDRGNLEKPGSDQLPMMFPMQGVVPDGLLTDGQVIMVGKLEIHVIHTPGHTPGSVCFYLPKEAVLISGDTLFRGSIGNLSFPTSSAKRMWPSLKKLAALPLETRVYPGHGESTTIRAESWLEDAEKKFGYFK
ncbi:MAG: MBL fold metallo-hydrolase [Chlamydiales bacterium]|nr:MBL fold metallo-hydrolase [Chlamydiales bacterium]